MSTLAAILPSAVQRTASLATAAKTSADVFGDDLRTAKEIESEHLLRRRIADTARQLVADALVTPILSEFRAQRKEGGPFGVTEAEKRLAPLVDGRVADTIVRRSDLPITRRIEHSLLKRANLKPQAKGASTSAVRGRGHLA